MRMKLAVSLLSSYLYCPRKVFLQKVLKLREPLRQPLILGTIRHQAVETACGAEEELVLSIGRDADSGEVNRLYVEHYASMLRGTIIKHLSSLDALGISPSDAYSHSFPSLLQEATFRAENTYSFFEKTKLIGHELWERLTPKIRSEVRIESDELQLVGIIDQVHDYGTHAVPVELKTGKMPKDGVWPGHRIQAAAYALMLEGAQGKRVPQAVVHYLDGNEKRGVVLNPFMREEIVGLVEEIKQLLDNTILPEYCHSVQKCAACGLKKECYNPKLMQSLLISVRAPTQQQLLLRG